MDHSAGAFAHGCPIVAVFAVGAALILSGCGSHGTEPAVTQVVAKVNGHELTVLQLNQALAQMQSPANDPAATELALKHLIDEELLVQAASSAKLDRDPRVQMRVAAVQREILARTFAEGHVYPQGAIDEPELQKFYDANPALFGARRIYHTLSFTTDQRQLPEALLVRLGQIHNADALRALLSEFGIHFLAAEITLAAEAIPLQSLPHLAAAGVGDVVMILGDDGQAQLLLLRSIDNSPVRFDQAKNLIAHFLRGKEDQAALQAYLQNLQSRATIQYFNGSASLPFPGR